MSDRGLAVVGREYRPLVRAALQQGWALSQTRHGHVKLTAPDGYATPIPSTSTSPVMWKAIRTRLLKHGVVLEV